jgi:hypothetical protein
VGRNVSLERALKIEDEGLLRGRCVVLRRRFSIGAAGVFDAD